MNNYLWKNYTSFQKELINIIENHEIIARDDCFLIEKNDWEKYIYNKINPNNQNNKNILYIQKKIPIENFSSAFTILKNHKKIKLVKKDLIAALYQGNNLRYFKSSKSFNYYCGNKKLLIEFNENYSCMALLILNPLDLIINNSKHLYVIAFRTLDHMKQKLYTNLLSQEIDLNHDILNNLEYNNIIITQINDYKNIDGMYPIEECHNINSNNYFKDNSLLTLFIYIFYYEKHLSNYKENTFDENESYFLINPKWLKYYKDFYNYKKLFEELKIISNNNNNNLINYTTLDGFMLNISNDLNNFFFEKRKNDINFDNIMTNPSYINKNIIFYENCFIIDKKIIDMMVNVHKNLNENIAKLTYKIKVKNKYIYLIGNNSNSISIGSINENLLFTPKFLFIYNNFKILKRELNLLFQKTIKEYIRNRNCLETYKDIQTLIEGKNNKIGSMIVLKVDEFKSKQINDIMKNKLEKDFNKNKEISKYKIILDNYKDNCLKKKAFYQSKSMHHSNISTKKVQSSKNSDKILKPKNLEDNINGRNIEIQIINKRKNCSEKKDKKNSQTRKNNHKNEMDKINYKVGEVPIAKIDLEEYQEKKDILNESKNNSLFDEIKRLKEKNLENEKQLKEELDKNNKILKEKENFYQKKIKEYEMKEKDIIKDFNKLKEELSEKKKEILQKEEKYNKIIKELESHKNKIEKENKRIKDENKNLSQKKGELNKIKEELNKYKNLLNLKNNEYINLQNKINQIEEIETNYKNDKNKYEILLKAKNEEIDNINKKYDAIKQELKNKEEEISKNLENKLNVYDQFLKEMNNQINELKLNNSEIQEKLKYEVQLKDKLIEENQLLKDKEINYINLIKDYEANENMLNNELINKIKSLENENSKIKEEKENLNKKNNELESNINSQKVKIDLLSEISNKNLIDESNKNFEKLLNEKNKENEKLEKNYKKILEEQKKLIDEVNLNKEKELLDKDNKLKELKEQNLKLNQINEEKNNEIKLIEESNKKKKKKQKYFMNFY